MLFLFYYPSIVNLSKHRSLRYCTQVATCSFVENDLSPNDICSTWPGCYLLHSYYVTTPAVKTCRRGNNFGSTHSINRNLIMLICIVSNEPLMRRRVYGWRTFPSRSSDCWHPSQSASSCWTSMTLDIERLGYCLVVMSALWWNTCICCLYTTVSTLSVYLVMLAWDWHWRFLTTPLKQQCVWQVSYDEILFHVAMSVIGENVYFLLHASVFFLKTTWQKRSIIKVDTIISNNLLYIIFNKEEIIHLELDLTRKLQMSLKSF